ncbi:MAG: DNA gyrase subunit A [Bacteroidota bacterium]|nr:DNA gyrase subunit A [Rhodothermia bacterium]MCS7155192.1 DNA gyrase subunit A [Bacteroidota bacterium]MDW8138308.1 DNA gyrase subunit A [Bacteroidota bacterium]
MLDNNSRERVIPISIEEEMKTAYIDYAMSVIVSRALPDVRDGLKPVQRRILYAMSELGLGHNRPYKKSARVVGEVLGKYHPHGDAAVYDTMVRMAQDFSMRYPLVDGQGNFGSLDGDAAAAMRYTEVRLTRLAEEMLRDIAKDTVDFSPNFDDSLQEPAVLPALPPNLLLNGASGIAVGMATNIPPHNLQEVVDGIIAYIDNRDIGNEELLRYIKGPDFPTGGIIYGYDGVREAYTTGKGKITVRARAQVETQRGGRAAIVVTEIPYLVNKAQLIEKIAQLVRDRKLDGIADIRDESDRDGLRVVFELKREADPTVVLNNLYKHTALQSTFGVILLALVGGKPKVLTLRDLIAHYVEHRHEVVLRRTRFELAEAEERAHLLEGLKIALRHLDAVIQTIRSAPDVPTAQERLMERFGLSERQARAILEMRLQRLTGLERQKIEQEYKETLQLIERLRAILEQEPLRMELIKEELRELRERYGDARRTEIVYTAEDFRVEDMIADEDVVVTITHQGFIKRTALSGYRRQGRGGKGVRGAGTREDDYVERLFVASTHHYLLFFTNQGRCYWLKVFEIPEGGRASRGRSIRNLIQIGQQEQIRAIVAVKTLQDPAYVDRHYILMATRQGMVKKTPLEQYSRPRRDGIIALDIRPGDELIEAKLTDGTHEIVLATRSGRAIRFSEREVRPMGRVAAGVKGIELEEPDDAVVGMVAVRRSGVSLLTVSERGYGKRSPLEEYRVQARGGKGVITMRVTDKTGPVIALREVTDSDELMLITVQGTVIRMPIRDIREMGRNTQGVRLIKLADGDAIADVTPFVPEEEAEAETST